MDRVTWGQREDSMKVVSRHSATAFMPAGPVLAREEATMVFERILAVVDASPAGTRAVRAGAALAAAARAELGVLRVIEDPWPFIAPGEVEAKRALRDDAWQIVATGRVAEEIRRMTAGLPASPARITPLVRFGPPAVEIARAAEAYRPHVIVVGTAPTGVIDVPCLVVPPEWRGWKRVVVWGEVFREAFAFAALFRSDVVVVDAEPDLVPAGRDDHNSAEGTARRAFAVWAKVPGTGAFDVVLGHGDPVTQAMAVARSERADVLVIEYPRVAGASAAAAIAHRAPCAVLLVPV